MSLYDSTLTAAERRALNKHTHDLQDEIDLLRVLVLREMDPEQGSQSIDKITATTQAIGRLAATRQKLQAKADDKLKLALLAALSNLDAEGE
jgi:hypothetical protein